MQTKRLYRSRSSRILGGVAGGLAEYFDIDPIIMRLVFIGLVFFGGGGVIIYIIMWIVVPENPDLSFFSSNPSGFNSSSAGFNSRPDGFDTNTGDTYSSPSDETKSYWEEEQPLKATSHNNGGLIAGLILITLGVLFLLERFVSSINFGDLWPALLIVAGIALLANANIKPKKN